MGVEACNVEAAATLLSEEEKTNLQAQVKRQVQRNNKLKHTIESAQKAREEIATMRQMKRDIKEATKEKEHELNSILRSLSTLDPVKRPDEVEKQIGRINKLDKFVQSNKFKNKDYSNEFKETIDALRAHVRSLRAEGKAIREESNKTKSTLVNRIINEKPDLARSGIFWDKSISDKKFPEQVFDQIEKSPYNLFSTRAHWQQRLITQDFIDAEKAYGLKPDKVNLQKVIDIAKRNLIMAEDELGLDGNKFKANEHPVYFNRGVMQKLFFDGLKYPKEKLGIKAKDDGIAEFQKDIEDHVSKDFIDEVLLEGDEYADLKTLVGNYRTSMAEGRESKLKLNRLEFKSLESANTFINKYSNKTIGDNYYSYLRYNAATSYAESNITGRPIRDEYWRMLSKEGHRKKDIQRWKNYYTLFKPDGKSTSSAAYRAEQAISKVNTLLLAGRAISVTASSFGDKAATYVMDHMEFKRQPSMLMSALDGAKAMVDGTLDTVKGGAWGNAMKYASTHTSHLTEAAHVFNDSLNTRFSSRLEQVMRGSAKSIMQKPIELIDEGLKAASQNHLANKMFESRNLSFDDLAKADPPFYEGLKRYGLNSDDWSSIQRNLKEQHASDKRFKILSSTDFTGLRARKVAAMHYHANLKGIGTEVELPMSVLMSWSHGNPALASFFSMFWKFTTKQAYYQIRTSLKLAETKPEMFSNVANLFYMRAMRGFLPELTYGFINSYVSGYRDRDGFLNESNIKDAMLGTLARPASAVTDLFTNPSMFEYDMRSPGLSLATDMINAVRRGDDEHIMKAFLDLTPLVGRPIYQWGYKDGFSNR